MKYLVRYGVRFTLCLTIAIR